MIALIAHQFSWKQQWQFFLSNALYRNRLVSSVFFLLFWTNLNFCVVFPNSQNFSCVFGVVFLIWNTGTNALDVFLVFNFVGYVMTWFDIFNLYEHVLFLLFFRSRTAHVQNPYFVCFLCNKAHMYYILRECFDAAPQISMSSVELSRVGLIIYHPVWQQQQQQRRCDCV